MFGVNVEKITELEIGLNNTLNWVIRSNYDLTNNAKKTNNFHPINFKNIEISKNLPGLWSKETCRKKMAVLISGQIQRFIFQDQFGALIKESTECEWTVDVFIALSNATM